MTRTTGARSVLYRITVGTAVALSAWTAAPSAAEATNVCASHGGIVYAGADSRGGSVHIICADGREFDV